MGPRINRLLPKLTGFLVLYLHSLHPPTLLPLLLTLSTLLFIILSADILRSNSKPFNVLYIKLFGPLMRKSEESGWNGVVWYLMGCLWTLGIYPRDVAVVSVLT
jgi:diacylglycerol kinase (CTP)